MYGDLVNLRTGAVDRRAVTKFLLKCKSMFPFCDEFHRNLICYELRKSSGKGMETQTSLSQAGASAAISV